MLLTLKISKLRFFLGSTPDCCHLQDLETAMKQSSILKEIDVELRIEITRSTATRSHDDWKQLPKAIHIYCSYSLASKCRVLLNLLYGSQNTSGYPLGRKMVFVPNIFDRRFPSTQTATMKLRNAIFLQKTFLHRLQVTEYEGVVGLHYDIPCKNVDRTLRETLMSICSTKSVNDYSLV